MGVAIFPNELCCVSTHRNGRTKQLFEFAAQVGAILDYRVLSHSLNEATTGLALRLRMSIDSLQERIRDRDHHLCHGGSIYGIASD